MIPKRARGGVTLFKWALLTRALLTLAALFIADALCRTEKFRITAAEAHGRFARIQAAQVGREVLLRSGVELAAEVRIIGRRA